MVQLSHSYMTTGKSITFTVWTFVGKVISLLFNMLSRLVIALLPRSKHLIISWLQSLFAVIFEPKKIKSLTVSIFPPSICHEAMGLDVMIFIFWMLSFKPAFSFSSFTFTGWSTSWNQDCREKYPQICRWHHPLGRKWGGTKEFLDKSERGEWKSWLKSQHLEN